MDDVALSVKVIKTKKKDFYVWLDQRSRQFTIQESMLEVPKGFSHGFKDQADMSSIWTIHLEAIENGPYERISAMPFVSFETGTDLEFMIYWAVMINSGVSNLQGHVFCA